MLQSHRIVADVRAENYNDSDDTTPRLFGALSGAEISIPDTLRAFIGKRVTVVIEEVEQ